MGDYCIIMRLTPDYSRTRNILKFILFSVAIMLLILALANLQVGSKLEDVKQSGVDIIIALDVSRSMLSEDIRPNRLQRSKMAISRLIDRFGNDRLGIVVFAGKSYTQLPLTHDKASFLQPLYRE